MKISRWAVYPFWIGAAVALLAGCSGSPSSLAPAGFTQPANRTVSYHGLLLPTAVAPNWALRSKAGRKLMPETLDARPPRLLYISGFSRPGDGIDAAFSVPHLKYVYDIKDLSVPAGECSKTGRGTFWVVDSGTDDLYEFRYHAKRPIKTLSTSGIEPSGCSVDPSSGDVAASIIANSEVLVWPKGGGTPTTYTTPLSEAYFVGYDGKGDLFVDGFNSSDSFGLAELPKGGSSFALVSLDQTIEFPGNIQWDGSYLALGDQNANVVYQFVCSGTSCSTHGSTRLEGANDCVQFWINKAVLACPEAGNFEVALWHYPAGGSSYAQTSEVSEPLGSVIVRR
jgi:hypothetical protein